MKQCLIEGCTNNVLARGWCKNHYMKWYNYGNPMAGRSLQKHDKTKTPEYLVWSNLKQRCYSPHNPRYKHYGGRGIRVCKEWRNSFKAFYEDMGSRPSPGHSINRINNDGNYEPGNCEWSTRAEQALNKQRRNNISGYRGVLYDKRRSLYYVMCLKHFFGYYSEAQEAAYVRDQVVMQAFTTSVPLNFEYI